MALDCLAAVALAALFLTLPSGAPLSLRLPLALAMGLPVAVRRLWPVPVLAVTAGASVAAAVTGAVQEPALSVTYALYWVAVTVRRAPWPRTPVIAGASLFLLLVLLLAGAPGWEPGVLPLQAAGAALAGAAWTAGRAVRERRAYAERSARQLAARAVAEERLRIARELHDVVAHHVGVIAVKAGVANHVLSRRPEEAGEALRVIETASRTALTEMRHMLGVLRSDGDDAAGPRLSPAVGLAGLPALVEHAGAAGVEVEVLRNRLSTDRLPETVDLSAYRIVQEALTNVIKHAGPTCCRVELTADEGELLIDVTDDGPRPGRRTSRPRAPGHGLLGMRERAALHGGSLIAGPRPAGGFSVRARLPYNAARTTEGVPT